MPGKIKPFDVMTSAEFDAAMKGSLSDKAQCYWTHAGDFAVTGKQLTFIDLGMCSREHMDSESVCLDWPGRKASVFLLLIEDEGHVTVAAVAVLKATKKPSIEGELEEVDYLSIDSASAIVADTKQLKSYWCDGGKLNESILGYQTGKKKEKDRLKADAQIVEALGFELQEKTWRSDLTLQFKNPLTGNQIDKINHALVEAGSEFGVNIIQSHCQQLLQQPLLEDKVFSSLKKDREYYAFAFDTGWGDGGYPIESITKDGVFKGYLCTFIDLEEEDEQEEDTNDEPMGEQNTPEMPSDPSRVSVEVPDALLQAMVAEIEDDMGMATEPYWLSLDELPVSGGQLAIAELSSFEHETMHEKPAVVDWPHKKASLYLFAYDDHSRDTRIVTLAVLRPGSQPTLAGEMSLAYSGEDMSDPIMVGEWEALQQHWCDGGDLNQSILGRMTNDKNEKQQLIKAAEIVEKSGLLTKQENDGAYLKITFKNPLTDEQIKLANTSLKKANSPVTVRVIRSHNQALLDNTLMAGSLYATIDVSGTPYVYAHPLEDDSCNGQLTVLSIKDKNKLLGYLIRFAQEDEDE
jgi:hypothetical protein